MKKFRGSVVECVAHLGKKLMADPDYFEKRQTVADFTRIEAQSIRRWFREGRQPVGEPLIRISFYLEFVGYDVTELESLNPTIRDAGRLLAFGVVDLVDLIDALELGAAKERHRIDAALAVLRGVRGVSEQKLAQLDSLVQLYEPALAKAQSEVTKVVQVGSPEPAVPSTTLATRAEQTEPSSHTEAIIASFAASVSALVPLAEDMVSDGFSAEDRARVRELAGGGVSRLQYLLSLLVSEGARAALAKQ